MEVATPLIKAKVVKSFGRLILDAEVSGKKLVSVFCASASAAGLCLPGTEILISENRARRYLRHQLEFVCLGTELVYANPRRKRELFKEAFGERRLPDFSDWTDCREIEADENLRYADFELMAPGGKKSYLFLETVCAFQNRQAVFPSASVFSEPAFYGEIARLRSDGAAAVVVMLVPWSGCTGIAFSWKHDPAAAALLFEAAKNGVNFVCYGCQVDKKSVSIANKIKIVY